MALPKPEPGLVINYSYLWHREYLELHEEGRKDRPALVIIAVEEGDLGLLVTVLPFTHSDPRANIGLKSPKM
jgi:hypothetical protein